MKQSQSLNLFGSYVPAYEDDLALNFSRSLGPGAKVAKKNPRVGDTIHMFGYPDKTTDWGDYGAQDSDGSSLYCTFGPVMTPQEVSKRSSELFLNSNLPPASEPKVASRNVFFVGASTTAGMWGGANFNDNGELVAVHSGGNRTPESLATANVSVISP